MGDVVGWVVQIGEREVGVRGAKRRLRWGGKIHFERREISDRLMGHRIVGEGDALSVERPVGVLRR